MYTIAMIQARFSATRLPGKVMLPLGGKPVLQHVIERTQRGCPDTILLTTAHEHDAPLRNLAYELGVPVVEYAGRTDNVFARYRLALQKFPCDAFLRVTADCPLLEPRILRILIKRLSASGVDYINGADQAGFADGIGAEIINANVFLGIRPETLSAHQLEHVTPCFYSQDSPYLRLFARPIEMAHYLRDPKTFRLTLDTQRDYERLQCIVRDLGPEPDTGEAIEWLEKHLEWQGSD